MTEFINWLSKDRIEAVRFLKQLTPLSRQSQHVGSNFTHSTLGPLKNSSEITDCNANQLAQKLYTANTLQRERSTRPRRPLASGQGRRVGYEEKEAYMPKQPVTADVNLRRDELYERVWQTPLSRLAIEFGVTGTRLKKVCELLDIPVPPRGYWAKLAVGKAPPVVPLPPSRPGEPTSWKPGTSPAVTRPKPSVPRAQRKKPPQCTPRGRIHKLARGVRDHFIKSRRTDEGLWLKPYKKLLADITTSEACLDTALGLANDLFNALEAAGHRVSIAQEGAGYGRTDIDIREDTRSDNSRHALPSLWSPWRPTVAHVGTVAVGLAIVETAEAVEMRYFGGGYIRETEYRRLARQSFADDRLNWTTTRQLPSGRFRIIAYSPYWRVEWQQSWDVTKQGRRAQIANIVGSVESSARNLVPRLEEADRQAEAERIEREAAMERYRRDQDAKQVQKAHDESAAHLASIIAEWAKRRDIEAFITGAEESVGQLPAERQAAALERLSLARDMLGSTDPMSALLEWRAPSERYQSRYDTGCVEETPAETERP